MLKKSFLTHSLQVLLLAIGVLSTLTSARAAPLVIIRSGSNVISDLNIGRYPRLLVRRIGKRVQDSVIIEGHYPKPDWSLIIGRLKIRRNKDGNFKLSAALKGPVRKLSVAAVGPGGQVQTEVLKIEYLDFGKKKISSQSRHSFSVGAGLSMLSYQQNESALTSAVSLSEKALTIKGSYNYRLTPRNWDLGLTVFGTAAVLSSNIPAMTARFLGANLRLGYALPRIREPWRLLLMFGGYYTTMSVTNDAFGFKNLSGPQLFPVLRRDLSRGDSLSLYLKYSPVSGGFFQLASFTSREMAAGVTYNMALRNRHSIPFSLDYSNLKCGVQPDGGGTEVPISLSTLSLSAGYNF